MELAVTEVTVNACGSWVIAFLAGTIARRGWTWPPIWFLAFGVATFPILWLKLDMRHSDFSNFDIRFWSSISWQAAVVMGLIVNIPGLLAAAATILIVRGPRRRSIWANLGAAVILLVGIAGAMAILGSEFKD